MRTQQVLITGGAGFVGAHLVHRLVAAGDRVRVIDDLSRPDAEENVAWLRDRHGSNFDLVIADVRDAAAVRAAVRGVDQVFHLAALNAFRASTRNVLEAIRGEAKSPALICGSTSEVYGALEDVALVRTGSRYEPIDETTRAHGISEARARCYGGTEQTVLEWAHTFGIRAVVLRMSSIYGPRQLGSARGAWVAYALGRALRGESIAVQGDGRHVRDILYIDDLVDAFLRTRTRIDALSGKAFNVGGGTSNATSQLELLDGIERLTKRRPRTISEGWRRGDQRYFVADTRELTAATGWSARTSAREGIGRLFEWLCEQPEHHTSLRTSELQASVEKFSACRTTNQTLDVHRSQ